MPRKNATSPQQRAHTPALVWRPERTSCLALLPSLPERERDTPSLSLLRALSLALSLSLFQHARAALCYDTALISRGHQVGLVRAAPVHKVLGSPWSRARAAHLSHPPSQVISPCTRRLSPTPQAWRRTSPAYPHPSTSTFEKIPHSIWSTCLRRLTCARRRARGRSTRCVRRMFARPERMGDASRLHVVARAGAAHGVWCACAPWAARF
jgi:hypothetical protein